MAASVSGHLGLRQATTNRDWDGFVRWVSHGKGVGNEMGFSCVMGQRYNVGSSKIGLSRLSLSQFLSILLSTL